MLGSKDLLAGRTDGRIYATVSRLSSRRRRLSVVCTECIEPKRCVLEQSYY